MKRSLWVPACSYSPSLSVQLFYPTADKLLTVASDQKRGGSSMEAITFFPISLMTLIYPRVLQAEISDFVF